MEAIAIALALLISGMCSRYWYSRLTYKPELEPPEIQGCTLSSHEWRRRLAAEKARYQVSSRAEVKKS